MIGPPWIGHCLGCRWWDTTCGPIGRPDWHVCRRMMTMDGGRAYDATSLAQAWECCAYGGEVFTAPAFGCIQYEPCNFQAAHAAEELADD